MTCRHFNRTVIDSRPSLVGDRSSRRRRCRCLDCGFRWTTYEFDLDQLAFLVNAETERRIDALLHALDEQRQKLRITSNRAISKSVDVVQTEPLDDPASALWDFSGDNLDTPRGG